MRANTPRVVLFILLAVAIVVPASGCRKEAQTPEMGLKAGVSSASADETSSEGSAQTGAAKSPTSQQSTATASTGSGGSGSGSGNTGSGSSGSSGGSGSGGSGSGGSNGDSGSSSSKPKPTGMVVKILWWNDTKTKAPSGAEIVYGTSSYKPKTTSDTGSGSIGPVPYGKEVQLIVYPDGRGGKKIVVPFTVDKSMLANSERDAIHVEVSDTRVRVLGNAVDGFDRAYDRY